MDIDVVPRPVVGLLLGRCSLPATKARVGAASDIAGLRQRGGWDPRCARGATETD
jgi:hypothetical protein